MSWHDFESKLRELESARWETDRKLTEQSAKVSDLEQRMKHAELEHAEEMTRLRDRVLDLERRMQDVESTIPESR